MTKLILIFSDGTGQRGGLRPDQKLSNVYKLYRATRAGPDSNINPSQQTAFYDPGLGRGEVGGWTFKRARQGLEAMIGTGIDTNIVDCYAQIISRYNPGDKICLFGFSRGAYTVRALASLMNLCGVPTKMPDGSPVPQHGKELRKIAEEAVFNVYNHGAGRPRGMAPFFQQREELGRRFRLKYESHQNNDPKAPRGNVEPHFIGVFDTVAALGSAKLKTLFGVVLGVLIAPLIATFFFDVPLLILAPVVGLTVVVVYWWIRTLLRSRKVFRPLSTEVKESEEINSALSKRHVHWAFWKNKNYDRYLSGQVKYARHALAIDEERASFPRVEWGMKATAERKKNQKPRWLKQVWFAGCHSDIGGSYAEDESRLSDIALTWLVEELKECVPNIQVRDELLQTFGDPAGLQHREIFMIPNLLRWKLKSRTVDDAGELHVSVIERLDSGPVPVMNKVEQYRPEQLSSHPAVNKYYVEKS